MTGAPLRAVIFDVDGTLVDSERHGHRVAFNLAFEAFADLRRAAVGGDDDMLLGGGLPPGF